MIRPTLLLCAGLYLGLMVLGEDHGQKRYGLMLTDMAPSPAPTPSVEPAPQPEAVVYIPARAVMEPAQVLAALPATDPAKAPEPQVELAATPTTTEPPLPQPDMQDGVLFMATTGINVRAGPGKAHVVLDSLAAGEQVLVIADENPGDGWVRIRLEGDGVEGYVAQRLLTALP